MALDDKFQEYFSALDRAGGEDRCYLCRRTSKEVQHFFGFAEDGEDKGARDIGTTIAGGSVFRVVEYGPGVVPRNHRTASIDYAVIMAGEIDMLMDDSEVHLVAGDVVVQMGTNHAWANRGDEPCQIAFILIGANPPWK